MDKPAPASAGEKRTEPEWLETVRHHVNSLRFGVVEIVVHESRVVQIDKTERLRFEKPGVPPGGRDSTAR